MLFLAGQPGRTGAFPGSNRFALTLGFLRYLEAAGMVTYTDWTDDNALSANLKVQAPLDLILPGIPVGLAAGCQDVGGALTNFRSCYVAASARVWRLDGTAGWGSGPQTLNGWFGGLSFSPLDGVELLTDWDTVDVNAGLKASVSLEALIGVPIRIGGMGSSAVTRNPVTWAWAVTLEVPLWWSQGPDGRRTVPEGAPAPEVADRTTPSQAPTVTASATELVALEEALVEEGFEEVRAGRLGDQVVVEYENNRYDFDQSDGLYVVLRIVERSAVARAPLTVVLKRHGLRLVEMGFPGYRPAGGLLIPDPSDFILTPPERPAAWASRSPRNPILLHSQIVLAPALKTFVGTETSVLEASLSFRPEVLLPLWPGFVGFLQADIPMVWTAGLADGGGLAYYRPRYRLTYALAQQAFGLGHGVMAMVSGGLFASEFAGGLGEVAWAIGDGNLALSLKAGWLADADYRQHKALTGSIRYRLAPIDLVGSLEVGRFVDDLVGGRLELSRWFGDTQVGFFFTKAEWNVTGFFISIPLTLRREMKPGYVQVRGARRWQYSLGTRVGGDFNYIGGRGGLSPTAPVSLEAEYLDESRISRVGLIRNFVENPPPTGH